MSWTATLLGRVAFGVYYPLSIIPVWPQPLGLLVPHTFALRAIRLILLDGRSLADAQVGVDLAVLAMYAVADVQRKGVSHSPSKYKKSRIVRVGNADRLRVGAAVVN